MARVDIPFNDLQRQHASLAEDIDATVRRVLHSGWYVLGPECEAFEAEFAAWCGTSGCVAVANGTDALEIALRSVGVSAGDEVITAANAGGYTSVACRAVGAIPVYVDVDAATLGIDPEAVAAAVTDRTAAIVATHLYGVVSDVEAVRRRSPRPIPIVEDAAQAHGAERFGRRAGALGDVAAFSFYPTKNLGAAGDGGAVVSDRVDILERARSLRQYGWTERNTAGIPGGRNSRLDELQAAILRRKLPHVEGWNERRRHVAARWRAGLEPQLAFVTAPDGRSAAHLCVARHPDRDRVRAELQARGVATGIHFGVPDHDQPAFRSFAPTEPLPVTDAACREVLSLPCFPELLDDELDRAIEITADVLQDRP